MIFLVFLTPSFGSCFQGHLEFLYPRRHPLSQAPAQHTGAATRALPLSPPPQPRTRRPGQRENTRKRTVFSFIPATFLAPPALHGAAIHRGASPANGPPRSPSLRPRERRTSPPQGPDRAGRGRARPQQALPAPPIRHTANRRYADLPTALLSFPPKRQRSTGKRTAFGLKFPSGRF